MISGIASPDGATGRIVRNIATGNLRLVVSADIVAEYFDIAARPSVARLFARHGVSQSEYFDILADLCAEAEWIEPRGVAPACRDEKDRKYLHCAVSARCEFIVTRDDDLLVIGSLDGTSIVNPGAFLARLRDGRGALDP